MYYSVELRKGTRVWAVEFRAACDEEALDKAHAIARRAHAEYLGTYEMDY